MAKRKVESVTDTMKDNEAIGQYNEMISEFVAARDDKLKTLQDRRAAAINELKAIDVAITTIAGTPPVSEVSEPVRTDKEPSAVSRARQQVFAGKQPRKGSLLSYALTALKKRPMKIDELAEAITKAGYKSDAKNFKAVLYQSIFKSDRIKRDADTGEYHLVTQ